MAQPCDFTNVFIVKFKGVKFVFLKMFYALKQKRDTFQYLSSTYSTYTHSKNVSDYFVFEWLFCPVPYFHKGYL